MPRTDEADAQYQIFPEPDGPDPRGPFRKIDTTANGKGGRYVKSLYYAIRNPYTGEDVLPRKGTCWRHNKEEIARLEVRIRAIDTNLEKLTGDLETLTEEYHAITAGIKRLEAEMK